MNNSLERLLDGMVSTIEQQIIPHVVDDFARGQAFGVIYMLRSIGKRATWSVDCLQAQIDALGAVAAELGRLLAGLPGAPSLTPVAAGDGLTTAAALQARRDAANRAVCEAYDWVEQHHADLPATRVDEVRATMQRYLTTQLKTELRQQVNFNFAEISTGHAVTAPKVPKVKKAAA